MNAHASYLSSQQVADILRIAPETVRKLANGGKLRYTDVGSGSRQFRRFDLADVLEFAKTYRPKPFNGNGSERRKEATVKTGNVQEATARIGHKPVITPLPTTEAPGSAVPYPETKKITAEDVRATGAALVSEVSRLCDEVSNLAKYIRTHFENNNSNQQKGSLWQI